MGYACWLLFRDSSFAQINESHALTTQWAPAVKWFKGIAQLQFRLNGKSVPTRRVLPFFKGKNGDLRFHRESGGYLFLENRGSGRRGLLGKGRYVFQ